MKTVVVIAAIAAVIRLATAINSTLTAVVVGTLAVTAAAYGLWSNGRFQRKGWRLSWGLVGLGLVGNVAGAVLQGADGGQSMPEAMWGLGVTAVSDLVAVAGLVLVIHRRLPGHWADSLATAIVAIASVAFPVLSLVVVPNLGWHPSRDLLPLTVPVLGVVVLCLSLSLFSLTERRPAAHRYLLGGFLCLVVAYSTGAALFLSGDQSSPVPLNAVVLWGTCLWSCALLHHSQRQVLDPVPFRSTRPGWAQVTLMVTGALVVPAVVWTQLAFHRPLNATVVVAGSAMVPLLVVVYLLYQVYARSAAEYRAQHDPLTGVCNRVLFNDRLEGALFETQRTGAPLAVMFLDLDRFKSINDSLGHAVGNQLLQAVVKRLQGRLRPEDTLGRMGGDEFTILFPDIGGKATGANLAERMLGAFAEPFNVGGKLLPVQASIGVAVHPDDGEDSETLFKNADTAMYQAKAAGRNTYAIYDPAMSAKAELRFALETSLRHTLEDGRLTVHYQPKLATSDGHVSGVEALARWEHPRLGFIPPSAFIPLAEETSLISTLGEWVLETACLQARSWQDQGLPAFTVAVNISPRQFMRQSVVRMVADVLDRTGLDPTLLELEVTESVLVEHMEDTAASLAELRAMGVRCSIDDFGTGYSALTYLTEMPVDSIKIDPSFVRRIDNGAAPIVGAVIALAHSLDLEVVAEGVESPSQLDFLVAHGCDHVQGYLFSPPVAEGDIAQLVENPGRLVADPGTSPYPASASSLIPPGRLAAVLDGVNATGDWAHRLDNADFLAVLSALQPDDLVLLSGARGSKVFPARMAVGTLAGLASVTGSLGAAGVLPGAPDFAGVLARAAGIPVEGRHLVPGGPGPTQLMADGLPARSYVLGADGESVTAGPPPATSRAKATAKAAGPGPTTRVVADPAGHGHGAGGATATNPGTGPGTATSTAPTGSGSGGGGTTVTVTTATGPTGGGTGTGTGTGTGSGSGTGPGKGHTTGTGNGGSGKGTGGSGKGTGSGKGSGGGSTNGGGKGAGSGVKVDPGSVGKGAVTTIKQVGKG